MKKKYIAPQVEEVKIKVEQHIMAGSPEVGFGEGEYNGMDSKDDWEWSFDGF